MFKVKLYSILLFLLGSLQVAGQAQKPVRITYAVKDTSTLWFDWYKPTAKANGMSVLFIHGGAFTGGDPENQRPMAEGLNKLGYNVFVIKYRLYLKGKSFGCDMVLPEKLKAIRQGVEDGRDATAYLINHAGELQVDTSKLFLAGSSAGAEAVLNLVFNPFTRKNDTAYNLYRTFRYAGVLSFAGAVLDINTVYAHAPVPVFMMHGTNDQLVPYATAAHRFCKAVDPGWMIMFGARTLYEEMYKRKWPVVLYSYEGSGHEVSSYMFRKFTEMDSFMQQAVKQKVKAAHLVVKRNDQPKK
ncbi:alpha/beta hydrolase [Longitalea luteola]|uniref:alpha/beta hydrolase n=1 Tax=Longitalea luteola TaxID=2812563 RepID=UPI001A958272|nr:alpha/beta hydrolase [Longitalea luteola]